ncbi:MAG: hypothetical protein ACREMY_01865 [bacterium]
MTVAQNADEVRPKIGPYKWLNDRANSYWRDADALQADGDQTMAVAYRTISEQLRRCAFLVGTVDNSALAAMEANERMAAHLADYPFVFGTQSDGSECAT